YIELFPSLYATDNDSALFLLKYHNNDPGDPYSDAYLNIQPEANLEKGIFRAFLRANAGAGYANDEWSYDFSLYEGYVTLMPNQNIIIDAGKKTLKWGKGYAWNPVAFVDRPKNPDDPELAYEGFTVATADFIVNFNSPLKTISFSPVIIPVYDEINSKFGKPGHWNYAGKLYFLFFDTDIDLLFIAGESRGDRFGIDVSRNITTAMEIHGECAVIPDYTKRYMDDAGFPAEKKLDAVSALAGVRYLTEKETTFIIEYYYNSGGMSEAEMRNYYNFIDRANDSYVTAGSEVLFEKAGDMTEGMYGRINPMRNYLYFRVSQNEPFNILYFTPAAGMIFNVDDSSFTLMPELLYTAVKNLELRLRYMFFCGGKSTEFGEKPADHKIDLRARYYF
ncbi:MAG: hypothetical protein MUC95_10035, partial [Spirochaetes bacterium]|nr:hypothetical protein [Spirochaetota bacterium]